MSKLDQLRAFRERQAAEVAPRVQAPPKARKQPAAEPSEPPAPFDRVAYQREYMRRWRAEHRDEQPTAVYRHYDAEGALLYVGVSTNLDRRSKQHSQSSAWWPKVARTEIEYLPTKPEALAAESKAVADETPLHNKQLTEQTIAPPGQCPSCDFRREEMTKAVQRHRKNRRLIPKE